MNQMKTIMNWRTIDFNISQCKLTFSQADTYDEAILRLDIAKINVNAARPNYQGNSEEEFASMNEHFDEMVDQIERFVIVREEEYA